MPIHALAADLPLTRQQILDDYRLVYRSRQASLVGRREVMGGRAKFGIFGDGKELPQAALAHAFRPGDWRSGYYRDQTWMLAIGALTVQQFFAQLYAHPDLHAEPMSAGRMMNAHFATRSLNPDGSWRDLTAQVNSSADLSPTAAQMPRLAGLAYASKLYRQVDSLQPFTQFSHNGDEIAFGSIGNASCAEGLFWETVNAIGVLRCPAILTIYDDGYGISVTNEHQIAKENLSELLAGFQRPAGECCDGYDLYTVKGWDYPGLVEAYQRAAEVARLEHMPSIIHVVELTQPQGHSTSGSHERYKTPERLEWEKERDCLVRFRQWVLEQGLTSAAQLDEWEEAERTAVEDARRQAWEAFTAPVLAERRQAADLMEALAAQSANAEAIRQARRQMMSSGSPHRRDTLAGARAALSAGRDAPAAASQPLAVWQSRIQAEGRRRYSNHLHSQDSDSALNVPEVKPVYAENAPQVMGYEVLNAYFDLALARNPRLLAFGEDVGRLGDVNQAFRGLQEKYGPLRVADTGIREATILGQAIGLALRGLRPIAEIQYLDYLLYALQLISDDLATLRWRTANGQKAPVIVRTRGHRLEGIWHSGSPMAGILGLARGVYLLTPRNMTQAAGFYNTLLRAEEPAIVVEALNGYRSKEALPANLGEFSLPLGVPEIMRAGTDVTLVTYGACCRPALEAAAVLEQAGIQAEVIDVQSLLPFDRPGLIGESLKKTSRVIFIDEDVPGGATAYMLQQVIEQQGGYAWLDSPPRTLSAQAHRPAYGSDGDYWSKPSADEIYDAVYALIHEVDPAAFPLDDLAA
jgi:pyruvate/2-oxoglutarate/acetoin dehydrogenase E1 component/TPP-dependent pyruvate/acetoin dehydrogenase alpha subunit